MKKRNLMIIIGVIAFIVIVGRVSYSYFVYNKDVANVSMSSGEISINFSDVNGSMSLTDIIPKSDSEGKSSSSYIDFTVDGTVDSENLFYELYILPDSNNTLDTSYLKVYLTDQEDNPIQGVSVYDDLANSKQTGGKSIDNELISINSNNQTKTYTKDFRLRLWLDEDYDASISKTFDFDIYLYSYNKGVICKRVTDASSLHQETCANSDTEHYCQHAGYAINDVITYGKAKTKGSPLETGDAFDCDVDGTGFNHRFYYLTDYYDTFSNTYDETTAVLIYYNNTINGVASVLGSPYATQSDAQALGYTCEETDGCNWFGPISSIADLPTINQWSNISLKSSLRKVLAVYSNPLETTNNGSNVITNPFSYSGKAARILSYKEFSHACTDTNNNSQTEHLLGCNFLFEGTKYTDSTNGTHGPWLEGPRPYDSINGMCVTSYSNTIGQSLVKHNTLGVRPVIEVPYVMLEY